MTLLAVVREVCPVIGVEVPGSVFTNIGNNRTMQEMLALANEMAQRIAFNTSDWTRLRATATYPGDDVTTAFDLPVDYQRMLLTTDVWRSTSTVAPMTFVPDTNAWLNRRARNITDAFGDWQIQGGKIHIFPAMGTGISAYHGYFSKNCIALASGGFGDSFMDDGDSFVLNERLLRLGMIWQWKAQKGTVYQEDLGTYEDSLAWLIARDSPSPIIIGRTPISVAARTAWPFPVPTP